MPNQLSKLTKRADAVAQSASVLVSRSIREIRGEIANLSRELNLAGNAEDREGVYDMIRKRMDRLSRDLHKLLVAQNQAAAKGAAKDASAMTGLEIRYSAQRAKAICELVTPAQGENLAAVFTDKMGENAINALREATVSAMRMQAVAGGSLKSLSRDMAERWFGALPERPSFVDVSGRTWNTATYFQMNVRTNTMRVYNDCLVDDVAQAGEDLMRVSKGGDPDCSHCFAWEGAIISISGKTNGLPTYEDARNGGCFHPNCTHTLEYVVEALERDEIALQQQFPFDPDKADDPDAQDERRYEIDQARYMAKGLTKEQARVAVDRDNLEASIRSGLIRADAKDIVAKMTDAQVTALCPDGNPPSFEPVKRVRGGTRKEPKYEPERWNHGKRGGVVHIAKSATAEDILKVCKVDGEPTAPNSSNSTPPTPPKPKDDKSTVQKTDAAHGAEGGKLEALNLPSSVPSKREDPDALPYLGGFKPSATIEDALSFTAQNVGEVDFDPSQATLGAINRFNEIMSFAIKEHGIGKFKKVTIKEKTPFDTPMVAGVLPSEGEISFNPKAMSQLSDIWRENVLKVQHEGEIRILACSDREKMREYVGAHEAAHVIFHKSECKDKRQTFERLLTQMNENGTLLTVSKYAESNYKELFAELYAMRYCGEKLPKEAEEALERILR